MVLPNVPASRLTATAPPSAAVMSDVSCASARCVAVGATGTAIATNAQAWTLAGGRWSTAELVAGTPSFHQVLSSVACSGATCVGVGYEQTTTPMGVVQAGYAAQLAGATWDPLGLPGGIRVLQSVSCVASTWCMAVGEADTMAASGVATVWNGSSWGPVQSFGAAGFDSVSCVTTAFCVAVGSGPSAAEWTGSAWTMISPPAPTPYPESWEGFNAVSCAATSFCLAIGDGGGCCGIEGGLAMAWDGTAWSDVAASASLSQVGLAGVACSSPSSCLVVGSLQPTDEEADEGTFAPRGVVDRWDGSSLVAVPLHTVGLRSELDAVGCTRPGWCVAVGNYESTAAHPHPLVERWDGTALAQMAVPQE